MHPRLLARRTTEGETHEIRRCLKRYNARELDQHPKRMVNLPAGLYVFERQEALPEVAEVMSVLPQIVARPPAATVYHVTSSQLRP